MATWRAMTTNDIKDVLDVANEIHPDLPESAAVFTERVHLFPKGCLVLVENKEVRGYIISHPIRHRQPPSLDSLIGEIALDADQYYIHDLAILPKMRGKGLAVTGMEGILAVAKDYSTTCLVSVYGTTSFWERFGFVSCEVDERLAGKVQGYGGDAVYLERQDAA